MSIGVESLNGYRRIWLKTDWKTVIFIIKYLKIVLKFKLIWDIIFRHLKLIIHIGQSKLI